MSQRAGYEKYKHFLVTEPSEYVTLVQTNEPKKFNSFHEPMWLELGALFKQLGHDSGVRAVVFTAVGDKAFTAGLDVKAASQGGVLSGSKSDLDIARQGVTLRRHILEFQDCVSSLERCEKPVITVMFGYSFGLAIDMATSSDIRICSADTKFSVKEVDIGIAADVGTLSRLPKVVGNHSWVKDVAFTARVFGAEEALKFGFVSNVFPDKAKAVEGGLELAKLIASKSPVAVQGTKDILNHARENTTIDNLKYTAVWNSSALHTEDTKKALLSGIQKRKPTFEKL